MSQLGNRRMRKAGIAGVSRRKFRVTIQRDGAAQPAADLVERNFAALAPNQLWVADITYIVTWMAFSTSPSSSTS